ncbi:MAG: aminotransferase class V-fold PLP-dependent enzyme, partial [Acidimicrobiia bacterium]
MTLEDLGPYPQAEGYDEAHALDTSDPLRDQHDLYVHSDDDLIYLDGNSLGRLPEATIEVVEDVTRRQWGDGLIRSWNENWWDLQLHIGDLLAPLLGASLGEVIISDSTSVNLYKLALSAINAAPERSKIVTDDLNFPTDLYILEGIARQFDKEMVIVASDGVHGPLEGLEAEIDESTALVSLSHTVFKSGYTYDIGNVNEIARRTGTLTLWDCSHSVGVVPIALNASQSDLAIGCTYKYLNGGPGSPAFIYVRTDLQESLENPITAWWGHAKPFSFDLDFRPVSGIRRFHTGTMPILSLAAAEAGITGVAKAGIDVIRAKSVAMTEYLIAQWDIHLRPLGFVLATPTDPNRRGSHVSLGHEEAWPTTRALIDVGHVLPDFRSPDNIRLGLS